MATKPITIEIPQSNTADAWNSAVKDGAEKAGVALPAPGARTDPPAKKDDEPVIYESSIVVNGQEIKVQDADPAKVIEKLSAAVQAAQASATPAAAAAAPEPPKPAFTQAELVELGIKLQQGDVGAIETFVEKSGIVEKILEKKGLNVDKLNAAVTAQQDGELQRSWTDATNQFLEKVKAGESDYPGGAQNTYLMGIMLAELGLREKPSVESFELAYAELKKRNMVFPVTSTAKTADATQETAATTEPKPQKAASSSTAVGSHGTPSGQERGTPGAPGQYELDIRDLNPKQYMESYNELARRLIAAGVAQDKVKDHIKIIQ